MCAIGVPEKGLEPEACPPLGWESRLLVYVIPVHSVALTTLQ